MTDDPKQRARDRARARYARLRQDPAWRERERIRLSEASKRRRADPEKREHDRAVNRERMARKRAEEPEFAERQLQTVRQLRERRRIDREFDHFISAIEDDPWTLP